MKPVRLAVVGLGWIGQKHAKLISDSEECELVGVCDSNEQLSQVASEYNVPFHVNLQALLAAEGPSGVVIATPNRFHCEMGTICARHGVDTLIEKPIAEDLNDARQIIAASRKHNTQVLVGHHRRYSSFVREARTIVQSGRLGKLIGVSMLWALKKPDDYFDLDWRCKRPGGGPTFINLIHEIDSLRFICGEIRQVSAHTSSAIRQLDVEDSLSASLTFESGILGSILATDAAPSPWSYEATTGENAHYFRSEENCYHFLGTKGSLSFPKMETWRYSDETRVGWQHPLATTRTLINVADPLQVQLRHFCRVILRQEQPVVDAIDGVRSLAVAIAMLESANCGRAVEVKQE